MEIICSGIDAGEVPEVSLAEALDYQMSSAGVRAAARALAERLRIDQIPDLPLDLEISVIVDSNVEVFHYRLSRSRVELAAEPAPEAKVKVTLQRAVDLALLVAGVPLMVLTAAGRVSVAGDFDDILGIFGNVHCPPREGRRSLSEMSRLLAEASNVRSSEISKLLDKFGRAAFADELVGFFADSMILSGLTEQLGPFRVRIVVGEFASVVAVAQRERSIMPADETGECDVTIEVPKPETAVLRLLGKIGDMDAVLSRKILLSGPSVDDMMPLLEQLSSGLTAFTTCNSINEAEWAFPA